MSSNIYIGYQGIGKSSTANAKNGFIDLESSNFRLEDGNRPKDWYKYYVNLAFALAKQGYKVFVSSHDIVRKEIGRLKNKNNINVAIIHPSLSLKEDWIKKLETRFNDNPSYKNELAYLNTKNHYTDNIKEMISDSISFGFDDICIQTINYTLIDTIKNYYFVST